MATRLQARVVRRSPLSLTESDERDLALIRTSREHRKALGALSGDDRLAGDDGEVTESVLLHGVFAAGLDAIRSSAQEAGYAELALQQQPEEPMRRRVARRRALTWADEA